MESIIIHCSSYQSDTVALIADGPVIHVSIRFGTESVTEINDTVSRKSFMDWRVSQQIKSGKPDGRLRCDSVGNLRLTYEGEYLRLVWEDDDNICYYGLNDEAIRQIVAFGHLLKPVRLEPLNIPVFGL